MQGGGGEGEVCLQCAGIQVDGPGGVQCGGRGGGGAQDVGHHGLGGQLCTHLAGILGQPPLDLKSSQYSEIRGTLFLSRVYVLAFA